MTLELILKEMALTCILWLIYIDLTPLCACRRGIYARDRGDKEDAGQDSGH